MSIIQEALRKAQGQVKGPVAAGPVVRAPDSGSSLDHPESCSARKEDARRSGSARQFHIVPKNGSGLSRHPRAVAIILAALLATACLSVVQLLPKKGAVGYTAPEPADGPKDPLLSSQKIQSSPEQDAAIYRPEAKKVGHPEFILNGIMYLENGPRAIINDAMVETGDIVDGAKVVKIDKRNVTLLNNDEEVNLVLK